MISIIAVGQKQPEWVNQAFLHYAGRLSGDQKILLKEVKAEPRTTGKTVAAMKSAEAQRIIAASDRIEILVALDERGKRFWRCAFRLKAAAHESITYLIVFHDLSYFGAE